MKHYKAIMAIQKRITELQHEIKQLNKTIAMPQMLSDEYYAKVDIQNFESEIQSLTTTLQVLIKL